MATVNMEYVEFYQPSLKPSSCHQTLHPPLQAHTQNQRAITSLTQALSMERKNLDCTLDISGQRESGMTATPNKRENVASQLKTNRDDIVSLQGTTKKPITGFLLISFKQRHSQQQPRLF